MDWSNCGYNSKILMKLHHTETSLIRDLTPIRWLTSALSELKPTMTNAQLTFKMENITFMNLFVLFSWICLIWICLFILLSWICLFIKLPCNLQNGKVTETNMSNFKDLLKQQQPEVNRGSMWTMSPKFILKITWSSMVSSCPHLVLTQNLNLAI